MCAYDKIRVTINTQAFTGHKSESVRCMVIHTSLSPFFRLEKEIDTEVISSCCNNADLIISLRLLKNLMSLTRDVSVLRDPTTLVYSQLRIPKNRAPVASCPIAVERGVAVLESNFRNTLGGRHFLWVGVGSFEK